MSETQGQFKRIRVFLWLAVGFLLLAAAIGSAIYVDVRVPAYPDPLDRDFLYRDAPAPNAGWDIRAIEKACNERYARRGNPLPASTTYKYTARTRALGLEPHPWRRRNTRREPRREGLLAHLLSRCDPWVKPMSPRSP